MVQSDKGLNFDLYNMINVIVVTKHAKNPYKNCFVATYSDMILPLLFIGLEA